MSDNDIDLFERQLESDQAGQADMLQALRSASLPDEFWMYNYKILPCPHGYRHSWTHCPFSHIGETARRRCPRAHSYLPDPCINARAKRQCPNGDGCPYAHNTFEQWLHPARYRTRLCYLGANCRRPTCFFAHSVDELRSVEENDNAATLPHSPAVMPALLPSLPIPPPLPSPSPSSSGAITTSGPSGEFMPLAGTANSGAVGPASATVGAPALTSMPPGPPLGLLQPVVLMGLPQPHQALRPDMLAPSGAVPCFVQYQPGPAMLHPAMPIPQPTSLKGEPGVPQSFAVHTVQLPPPGPTGQMVAVRPPPRPHIATQATTMTVAAVHHPGSMHLAPSGSVLLHGGMPPPIPTGGLPPPPPPPPPPPSYSSPFVSPAGYYRGGEGVPPVTSRARSYSNPGEIPYTGNAGPVLSGGSSRTYGGDEQPLWTSADASRRTSAGYPSSVAAAPSLRLVHGGGGGRGVGGVAALVPRHMPAPTNRGGVLRRMSTPAGITQSATAVTNMHARSAGPSPMLRAATPAEEQLQQQRGGVDDMEAALNSLSLTKSVAAPPSTPVASHLAGGGSSASPYSPPLSVSSYSQHSSSAIGSPPMSLALDCDSAVAAAAAAAAAQQDVALLVVRASLGGSTAVGGAVSRPSSSSSSSGSATSGSTMLSAYDSSAAAAAAALAAVAVGPNGVHADAATVTGQYHTLLQHVLRSVSASAVEHPSGLLPTLLTGSSSDMDALHADVCYDDVDVDPLARSSDPGPAGLRAAIRRISTEFGSAAACRNSDPGQSVSPAGSEVQLLLPLLQTVLATGLANGQLELVNGQLHVKSAGSPSAGSAGPIASTGPFVVSSGSTSPAQ